MAESETLRGERLDQRVARKIPSLSRTSAAKLVELGKVKVNGKVELKAGHRMRLGDRVKIDFDESEQTFPDIEIEVVYEDPDCVVINKPAGLLSHSKGAFNPEATVATWLHSRVPEMTGDRAGIVHRLDRSTSGVMIVAKTPVALAWLQKQFSQRKVKKAYVAVTADSFKQLEAIIDMPIERNPKKPQAFRVGSNGKSAVTAYKVISSFRGHSLVELKPETGRTHQLRVHLSHLGHPILGDPFYGGQAAERMFLHAKSLELTLPNGERQIFTVPVPREFKGQVS